MYAELTPCRTDTKKHSPFGDCGFYPSVLPPTPAHRLSSVSVWLMGVWRQPDVCRAGDKRKLIRDEGLCAWGVRSGSIGESKVLVRSVPGKWVEVLERLWRGNNPAALEGFAESLPEAGGKLRWLWENFLQDMYGFLSPTVLQKSVFYKPGPWQDQPKLWELRLGIVYKVLTE